MKIILNFYFYFLYINGYFRLIKNENKNCFIDKNVELLTIRLLPVLEENNESVMGLLNFKEKKENKDYFVYNGNSFNIQLAKIFCSQLNFDSIKIQIFKCPIPSGSKKKIKYAV